jgi:hypothetical protein
MEDVGMPTAVAAFVIVCFLGFAVGIGVGVAVVPAMVDSAVLRVHCATP